MQRIKSITLENFKFFYGDRNSHPQNTLEINKNNVLFFGENGSGKSSIYWALYTFLQSCLKTNNTINKYFQANHPENLRNRFCEDNDNSSVEIYFEDDNEVPEIRKISFNTSNTSVGSFVKRTLDSSDFINYKYLSKIYDFRNSEPIDLFPLFEKEVLMFIDFEEEYYDLSNTLSGKTYASDWWEFINEAPKKLPKNSGMNTIKEGSDEYRRFKNNTIPRFIELLKKFLLEITESANSYLENEFQENYIISFNVESIKCEFNKNISKRTKDGKIHKPRIPLELRYNHSKLPEPKKLLNKPHTFLNEARLTAIALAIRLAMLDSRPTFPNTSSILVLDDLLLSLDMSHRNIVLDIILKKTKDFQLIILTHDKLFFEMAKHKIKSLKQNNWEYFEMYSNIKNDIPLPFITKSLSYIEKAEKYLVLKEYEIAGNFLRKEAESFCKDFLPLRLQFKPDFTVQDLNGLIQQSINYMKNSGINTLLFDELDRHRKFVLNSTSHDSYDVPKFKSEVNECLNTLKQLKLYDFKKNVFEKDDILLFEMVDNDEGSTWLKEYEIQDDFRLIRTPNGDVYLSKGIVNFTIYKNGEFFKKGNELISFKTDYDNWYKKSTGTLPANFWDGVVFKKDSSPLRTII